MLGVSRVVVPGHDAMYVTDTVFTEHVDLYNNLCRFLFGSSASRWLVHHFGRLRPFTSAAMATSQLLDLLGDCSFMISNSFDGCSELQRVTSGHCPDYTLFSYSAVVVCETIVFEAHNSI